MFSGENLLPRVTQFLGLSVSVVLQFAEERVLLSQQHFDVLHAHSDYPGANVRLKSVDTLARQKRGVVEICRPNSRFFTVTRCILNKLTKSLFECELCRRALWCYSSLFIALVVRTAMITRSCFYSEI